MLISPRNALAALLLLIRGTTTVTAQAYLSADQLSETWTATTSSVLEGNGAFMSPDGQTLVVESRDCTLVAYEPNTGAVLWTYSPTDAAAECFGGIFFSYGTGRPSYLVYSAVSGGATTVIAVNPVDGSEVLTANVPGTAVGTPVTSSDGQQILVTTNPTLNSGLFTLINVGDTSTPALTFDIAGRRASAIGAYWNPTVGYYEGGETNSNDIFIFGQDFDNDPLTNPNATAGDQLGQMYVFQNPFNPNDPLEVTAVGGPRTFLSNLPPVLAKDGFNLYWAVVRSELRCWAGRAGLGRNDFNSGPLNTQRFMRGNPGYAAPKAPPVTSKGATPLVYGPSAANEIYSFDENCTDASRSVFTFPDPTTVVSNKLLLSMDDLYLYVSTPKGQLHFFDAFAVGNGPTWNYELNGGIVGEMAMSMDGSHIYTVDVGGIVRATRVGDPGAFPTIAPVDMTTTMAPMAVGVDVPPPVMPPVDAPNDGSTEGPTFSMMPVGSETQPPAMGVAPQPTPVQLPQPTPITPPIFQPTPTTPPPSAASSVVLTLGALVLATVSMMLV